MHQRVPLSPAEERRRRAERDAPPRTRESALLDLQRTAGNRAVGAMLARDVDVSAEALPTAAEATDKTLGLGRIGVIPVQWFQIMSDHELSVTLPDSPVTPDIMRAASTGELFDEAWLSSTYWKLTLYQVMIASARPGGADDALEVQLNYTGRKLESSGIKPPGGTP